MIPYGRQDVTEDDVRAVVEVLRSDWLTQGPAVTRFEEKIAGLCGARHAVAVSSGTAGLHLACLALGLGPGDRLWTVPITYVASALCGPYCGARTDLVDIEPRECLMDMVALEARLERARAESRLPKVVMPVHLSGHVCDMTALGNLAERYGFAVVEDASHAVGSRHGDVPVGACRHSAMTVFSFHPVKIVTTAEGGLVTTNDDALAERLREMRQHGITRDPDKMHAASPGGWYYEQQHVGFNYRMSDLHAALGTSQLDRLEAYVARRNELADRYREAFAGWPIRWQEGPSRGLSAHHLFVARIPADADHPGRDQVFAELREAGIGVQVHYIPVHLQPFFRARGFAPGDYPHAETYYREALSLPLYPALTGAEQQTVIDRLRAALDRKRAGRA